MLKNLLVFAALAVVGAFGSTSYANPAPVRLPAPGPSIEETYLAHTTVTLGGRVFDRVVVHVGKTSYDQDVTVYSPRSQTNWNLLGMMVLSGLIGDPVTGAFPGCSGKNMFGDGGAGCGIGGVCQGDWDFLCVGQL